MPLRAAQGTSGPLTTHQRWWDTQGVANAADGGLLMRVCFGSVGIEKEWCPNCRDWAFVLDGIMVCCGFKRPRITPKIYRGSIATGRRQRPSSEEQGLILSSQRGRCFYCGSVFGDVARHEKMVKARLLLPVWDHVEPFIWQSNNQTMNFVAACWLCNGIKGSLIFSTPEEAVEYVYRRRKQKGWFSATEEKPGSPMRQLWRTLPHESPE